MFGDRVRRGRDWLTGFFRLPGPFHAIDYHQIAAATLFTAGVYLMVTVVPKIQQPKRLTPYIEPRGDGSIYMMPLPELVFDPDMRVEAPLGVDDLLVVMRSRFSELSGADPVYLVLHMETPDGPIPVPPEQRGRRWNALATLRSLTLAIDDRPYPLANLQLLPRARGTRWEREVFRAPTLCFRIYPFRIEVAFSPIVKPFAELQGETGVWNKGVHRFAFSGRVSWRYEGRTSESAFALPPVFVRTGANVEPIEYTRKIASIQIAGRYPDMVHGVGRAEHVVEMADRTRLVEVPGRRLPNPHAERRYSACVTGRGNVIWVAGRDMGAYDYDPDIHDPYYWLWPTYSVMRRLPRFRFDPGQ